MGISFSLTILALTWVAAALLFSESKKEQRHLLNRLKTALTVTRTGVTVKESFNAIQDWTIPEIEEYGHELDDAHPYANTVRTFLKKHEEIEGWKRSLMINWAALSVEVIFFSTLYPARWLWWSVVLHTLFSSLLSFLFFLRIKSI